MDKELREAERTENWQRVYALLCRQGKYEEAEKLFLDHPIQVSCVIQYRFRLVYNNGRQDNNDISEPPLPLSTLIAYDLQELIQGYLDTGLAAGRITDIKRQPVYHLLDSEIIVAGWGTSKGPLPVITYEADALEQFKDIIRGKPSYLMTISVHQRQIELAADARDNERKARRLEQQQRYREQEQQRRNAVLVREQREAEFLRYSRGAKYRIWAMWIELKNLERRSFAEALENEELRFILFKLKDQLERGAEVTRQTYDLLWQRYAEQRRSRWKKLQ